MLELSEIKVEVDRLAHRIGASGCVLPTYGSTDDGAKPHIETDVRGYHYVVVERGKELRRITTRDLGELLFHIFEAVTFSLACDYELSHHVESQDRRRMIFRRQSELLAVLSREWSDRASRQHEQILREHPYDDLANARVNLANQVGWKAACEKYPLPTNSSVNQK